jgi:hypothetical protein
MTWAVAVFIPLTPLFISDLAVSRRVEGESVRYEGLALRKSFVVSERSAFVFSGNLIRLQEFYDPLCDLLQTRTEDERSLFDMTQDWINKQYRMDPTPPWALPGKPLRILMDRTRDVALDFEDIDWQTSMLMDSPCKLVLPTEQDDGLKAYAPQPVERIGSGENLATYREAATRIDANWVLSFMHHPPNVAGQLIAEHLSNAVGEGPANPEVSTEMSLLVLHDGPPVEADLVSDPEMKVFAGIRGLREAIQVIDEIDRAGREEGGAAGG